MNGGCPGRCTRSDQGSRRGSSLFVIHGFISGSQAYVERSAEIAKSGTSGAGGGTSDVVPEFRSITRTLPSSARYPSTAGLACAYAVDASGGLGETMIRAPTQTSVAIEATNGCQIAPGAERKTRA